MRSVSEFEPFVLAYVPYVPSEIVQHSIRETIVEFMRETRIATASLSVTTQEKVPDYMLEVPDCRRIVKVKSVSMSPVKCSGQEHWNALDSSEYKVELRLGEHPIIVLDNPPKNPHKLSVEYVWTIGRDDCDIPDFIYEDYMQAIVAGTLVRLGMLPGNERLSNQVSAHQQIYHNAVVNAKLDRSGGKAKRIIGAPILSRRRVSVWR